jgi:DNA gyrase subunit A
MCWAVAVTGYFFFSSLCDNNVASSFGFLTSLQQQQQRHHRSHRLYQQLPESNEGFGSTSSSDDNGYISESEIAARANAMLTTTTTNGNNNIIDLPDEISSSFMQYALSIILGRALPDARDGLKPVHRRILYAMNGLGLSPGSSYRKCARVVGEVLGKYHPHGDTAVYDALVRLAQTFSTNMPLVDGHGNFGSIDADPAAAMRYTECRLTRMAAETLLDDINLDTVDFLPNFDGNEYEPSVLPAKVPVLLLNGAAGIAVGMATNVPPHNLGELMDACVAITKGRNNINNSDGGGAVEITDTQLMQMIPGPDFPTEACIIGKSGARKLYTTGNGGIVMRAVMHLEQVSAGRKGLNRRNAIIITELPYQVNKAALLERIAALVNEKKLDGIADLRDESDRDGIRMVIELKRDAVAAVVQNNLLKKTPLQTTFSGNFLALFGSGTVPQRFTLREALDCFLEFRFQTIRKKCVFQLDKVENRAHIVEGLLIALDYTDEVIDIVRKAPDQTAARDALMDEKNPRFCLSSAQADAVLKLQLGQLTRLNGDKLSEERNTLLESQTNLRNLLTSDIAVREVMIEEFVAIKGKFGTPRKTKILPDEEEKLEIDLVQNERSVIVVTRGGYMKRMPLQTFESQNRGTRGKSGTSNTKSDDNEVSHCFTCNDHDTLLMTTQTGIAYGLRAYQVPEAGRTAKGTPIPSVLPVKADDIITSVLPVSQFSKDEFIVLTTEYGWIKKTPLAAFEKIRASGLTIATLEDGDRLNWCEKCTDEDDILVGSTRGQATRFQASNLRPTARTSRGVKSMTLKKGDTIADMNVLSRSNKDEYLLVVTKEGYGKRVRTDEFRSTARGGSGVMAIKFKAGRVNDRVSSMRVVNEDDEILLITSQGVIVRQKVKGISCFGRAATGVLVQKVDVRAGDSISTVSIVPKEDSDQYDITEEVKEVDDAILIE